MPSDGKSSHCLWQGELKTYRGSLMPFNQGMCSVAWGGTPNMHILFFISVNQNLIMTSLPPVYRCSTTHDITEILLKVA